MKGSLAGLKIAVLGGDARERVLILALQEKGARVRFFGIPPGEDLGGAEPVASPQEAVAGAEVVILPLPGVSQEGKLYAPCASQEIFLGEDFFAAIPAGTPLIVGVASGFLRAAAGRHGLRLFEIAERDELAVPNAVPSAEGAIQIAMEELPITIHGSNAVVLGFGRLGKVLARTLKALGARTRIVARSPRALGWAWVEGYEAFPFSRLEKAVEDADAVFNTVPALVLGEEALKRVPRSALIIDLASAPGGVDFGAAARLGRKAIFAPGLPGKVAPLTAGRILARVVPCFIEEVLGGRGVLGSWASGD